MVLAKTLGYRNHSNVIFKGTEKDFFLLFHQTDILKLMSEKQVS